MSKKGLLLTTLLAGGLLFITGVSYASKTTDLMSDALKQRSKGNITGAIKGFKQAVDSAPTLLQRNLALFMLGDCQMEISNYSEAVTTFSELSKKATTPDERAEALYKLMEANSNLGNSDKVNEAYSELKRKYPKSAYREIGDAYMKAENIMESEYTGPIDIEEPKTAIEKPVKENKTQAKTASKAEPKPVKPAEKKAKAETKPTQTASKPASSKPVQAKNTSGKKLDNRTTAILEEILHVEPVSDSERDDLVSKILSYQDKLKDGEKGPGKDKVLFNLAEATFKFGELLEACKTYDKILSLYPASPLVEEAYYQSIRLRAILGVHQAVVEWSRAFNITFPESKFKQKIAALVSYSQAGGKVQLAKNSSASSGSSAKSNKKTSGKSNASSGGTGAANADLKASSMYQNAVKKMNDGKYSAALEDLKVLESKFSDSSQLWWDTTLVYVQLEEFKQADKSIKKMLLLDPENSDAKSLLGYIQYRLENYDEAASAYEQAGESEGEGVSFFDTKTASERMKKSASR
jgi:tetratricopeptide (TPR) repeat protein